MLNQWNQFLSIENFRIALRRLQTANSSLYKRLYYPDLLHFALFEQENIEFTIHLINESSYEPKPCTKYYIPKKKNLVRPLSLLHFTDLLIYQALINVFADILYERFFPFQNRIVFGNIFRKTTDKDSIFFFLRWQEQWKKYNKQTISYHQEGYIYFSDFDFASFYDTIEHDILCKILHDFGIEEELLKFFKRCLNKWTVATNRNNYGCNNGIPQGPLGSAFLADVYLLPIDKEVTEKSTLDIKYFRYVDDIRILSKTEIEGQKAITFIDLIARDFGLIPQSEKVGSQKIDDIKRELNKIDSRFSDINNEFIQQGKKLKQSTNTQLKKHFLNCFQIGHDNYLNKTIISFALFKLNKDDEVRDAILKNIETLYLHFEGVAFYFKKHYENDSEFCLWIEQHLKDTNILFHHIVALIFKNFPTFKFEEEIFEKHYLNNKQFWLTKYFLLDWLYKNNKLEILRVLNASNNYYVDRKLNSLRAKISHDDVVKKVLITELLRNKNEMIALQGLYIATTGFWFMQLNLSTNSSINPYVKNILLSQKDDYINDKLKDIFEIESSTVFFNLQVWSNETLYSALKSEFALFVQNRFVDASVSLMSLNLFNEMIFDRILDLLGKISSKGDTYGGSIELIKEILPNTYLCFSKVNITRNEKTYAHYKDKTGNVRIRITFKEYENLLRECNLKSVFKEICDYKFTNSESLS